MKITPNTVLKARSACDHECVFEITVLSRSGQFATVDTMYGVKRCKIKTMPDGEEFLMAHGRFSMAPAFMASKASEASEAKR